MKALAMHLAYFRLPDNFNGNVADALRLMADYHEKAGKVYKPVPQPVKTELLNTYGVMFDEFIEATQNGKRLVGLIQLRDFDPRVEIAELQ